MSAMIVAALALAVTVQAPPAQAPGTHLVVITGLGAVANAAVSGAP